MGMYSNFVLAEPANLIINATNEMFKDIGIYFDKPCTLEELGKYMSGWKIYGYFENFSKTKYKRIIDEIHNQHPKVNFKLHFWYEENIMFYFCWENGAIVKHGKSDDCMYFVSKEIINNITGIFNNSKFLLDRYKYKTTNVTDAYRLSEKEVTEDSNKTLLYLPVYLKCCPYFREIKL